MDALKAEIAKKRKLLEDSKLMVDHLINFHCFYYNKIRVSIILFLISRMMEKNILNEVIFSYNKKKNI